MTVATGSAQAGRLPQDCHTEYPAAEKPCTEAGTHGPATAMTGPLEGWVRATRGGLARWADALEAERGLDVRDSATVSAPVLPVDLEVGAEAGDGLSEDQLRVLVAVGAFSVRWLKGPPAAWVADRLGWSRLRTWAELERLRRRGWVAGSEWELRATDEGVAVALACWRALEG
jgi:hypothetical protein